MSIKGIIISGIAFLCLVGALTLFPGGAQGKSGSGHITATLEPSQILEGGSAVLSVSLSGAQTGQPNIPRINGLRFIPAGQSSQYQSLNGRVSSSVSYLYRVEADRSGDFTIPPVEAMINGDIKSTQPLSLRVLKTLPPPSSGSSRNVAPLSEEEAARIVFLRVIPAKDRLYVGEMAPVEIKAFFREGLQATLNTLPRIDGDAFAWQSLNKEPQQTREVIDGRVFHVLTWYTAISGVKEGEYPLSVQLDATVLVPDNSRPIPSPFGRSLFDDDFFNSFFTRRQQRQIKTEAPPQKMRVLPLPQLGRPEDFNGAIGRFQLSATASPKRTMVGDPVTLKITVKGSGNFDRVLCPELSSDEGWKTYSPSAAFEPSDSSGYNGKKVFEQAVIPLDASLCKIPPVVLCYFDSQAENYVRLSTKPIPVKIASAEAGTQSASQKPSCSPVRASGSVDASPKGAQTAHLAPIHITLGTVVASLHPTIENPWFLGAQGIPLGALFTGLFLSRRRRRLTHDPESARRKQVKQRVSRSVKEMEQAIAGHDVEGFFRACRSASQERLGEIWALPPEGITLAEVKELLPESAAGIRQVFETADAVAYSGQTFTQEELRRCKEVVIKELKNLEGKR
jgi:hypothetical protein